MPATNTPKATTKRTPSTAPSSTSPSAKRPSSKASGAWPRGTTSKPTRSNSSPTTLTTPNGAPPPSKTPTPSCPSAASVRPLPSPPPHPQLTPPPPEYAAAFFLLASDLPSALSIILHHLHDLQLAITIALVYEPPASPSPFTPGPILTHLLTTTVLPLAASTNNRYLASWAYYLLRRRDLAVLALVTPIASLIATSTPCASPSPSSPAASSPPPEPAQQSLESKLFLTDDPALVILYAHLRTKTLQTLRGAARVAPRVEWAFVLHNARLYERMGCDLLGLDLVRNWEFLHAPAAQSGAVEEGEASAVQPAGGYMRRRGSSLVVADLPAPAVVTEMKSGGMKPHGPPTVFEEPDANSLLDSFGF